MIRREKTVYREIFNDPFRLCVTVKKVTGSWNGHEVCFEDFDRKWTMCFADGDDKIKDIFCKINDFLKTD